MGLARGSSRGFWLGDKIGTVQPAGRSRGARHPWKLCGTSVGPATRRCPVDPSSSSFYQSRYTEGIAVDLRRFRALMRCTAMPPCRGHEIADGRGAIIPPIGKADRRAGRLIFNSYIGEPSEMDLTVPLRRFP